MPLTLLIVVVLFVAFFVFFYFRLRGNRDVEWERRWRQLDWADRHRLSSAVRRGEKIEDPAEAELAAGSAKQQHEMNWGLSVGSIAQMAVAVLIALAGIAQGALPITVGGLVLLGVAWWRFQHARARARNLAQASQGDRPGEPTT